MKKNLEGRAVGCLNRWYTYSGYCREFNMGDSSAYGGYDTELSKDGIVALEYWAVAKEHDRILANR